mgnify:FL=1
MNIRKYIYITLTLLTSAIFLIGCGGDTYTEGKAFLKKEKEVLEKLNGSWSRRVSIDEIESLDTFRFEIFDEPTVLKSQGMQAEFHGKMIWTNTTVYLDETEEEETSIYFYVEPKYDRICGYGWVSSGRYDIQDAQVFDYVFFNEDSLKLTENTIGHSNSKELKRVIEVIEDEETEDSEEVESQNAEEEESAK